MDSNNRKIVNQRTYSVYQIRTNEYGDMFYVGRRVTQRGEFIQFQIHKVFIDRKKAEDWCYEHGGTVNLRGEQYETLGT